MLRNGKRPISKSTSGSPDLPITRSESAFDVTCHRCGRQGEAREIEIELPKALGQKSLMWTRLPDGWWLQGSFLLNPSTAGCPGCMETPLEVAVAQVAATRVPVASDRKPHGKDD
jgi:hypothetical protein